MEAVCHYCERYGMEIETAARLLGNNLRKEIGLEANDLNMMKDEDEL